MTPEILKCPVCHAPLSAGDKTFYCANQHSFDRAKEGYLNLLLNAKKSAGDAKEMMQARQDFLAAGYYQPIAERVNALLSPQADEQVLDIGTGIGYYLAALQRSAPQANYYGLDISKIGIKMAAKQQPAINWLVANFAQLPFLDHSLNHVLAMFSEYKVAEIERVLTENGQVLLVRAGKNHLQELKEIIYPSIHDKAQAGQIKTFPHFNLRNESLSYQTRIQSSAHLLELLRMTPHYWKISPERASLLQNYQELTVTVHVELDLLTRKFEQN